MKKLYLIILIVWMLVFMAMLLFCPKSHAVGPNTAAPHKVSSDDMSASGCTFVYVYWRKADGVSAFNDTNRVNAGKIWASPYNMLLAIKVADNYELAGSCNDDKGNESSLSNNGTGRDGSLPFTFIALPSLINFGLR